MRRILLALVVVTLGIGCHTITEELPARPDPIYFNPIIEEVEMAPYVNDEGNLVFPGKVLVIREPGHWNLEAAQKNRQYFVPADNQPPQLAPPSKSYLRLHG